MGRVRHEGRGVEKEARGKGEVFMILRDFIDLVVVVVVGVCLVVTLRTI